MNHPPPADPTRTAPSGSVAPSAPFASAEQLLAAITQSLGTMVSFVDTGERIVYVNDCFAGWIGISGAQIIGKTLSELYGKEAYALISPHFRQALDGVPVRYEREFLRADGSAYWISVALHPHRNDGGEVIGVFTAALEVDELKRTRDALDKAMQVQGFHMENSPLAVIEWSSDVAVERWSGQAEAIFGWRAEEVLGRYSRDIGLVHPDWVPTIRASTLELLEGRAQRNRMIARNRTKSGRYIYCEWFNSAYVDGAGKVMGILSLAQDVTLRIEAEEQLRHAAVHDALTGLLNRQSLIARLDHALARARRNTSRVALLFIDLDRFKPVNDTHGHAVGDELLREVARRLKACVREIDSVARLGGDEFVVLLESDVDDETQERIRQRIVASFNAGFEIGGRQLDCGASIGVGQFPEHGGNADQLLASADRAMYRAKQKHHDTPP